MEIPRRNVELGFENVPRDWMGDDAYLTTFWNALSLLFPEGEQFFVRAVKQLQDNVDDPELKQAVVGFIGQEAMHGREHRDFNEMIARHGYPTVDVPLKRFLQFISKRVLTAQSQLAATAALEHFTAMLAEMLLKDARVRNRIHAGVRPLWLWHALEESEHKAVAFDVYRASGGTYSRRVYIMLLATVVFFAVQAGVHARLMSKRGILGKPWRWLHSIREMWIYPGHLTRLVPAYFAYFKPSFHPNERDTDALLAMWKEELFGANGSLREKLAA
jgi:predicted metal-dependent hydrolase